MIHMMWIVCIEYECLNIVANDRFGHQNCNSYLSRGNCLLSTYETLRLHIDFKLLYDLAFTKTKVGNNFIMSGTSVELDMIWMIMHFVNVIWVIS